MWSNLKCHKEFVIMVSGNPPLSPQQQTDIKMHGVQLLRSVQFSYRDQILNESPPAKGNLNMILWALGPPKLCNLLDGVLSVG